MVAGGAGRAPGKQSFVSAVNLGWVRQALEPLHRDCDTLAMFGDESRPQS